MRLNERRLVYLLLEMSLIPIVSIMYSSSTKESLSANVYLVSYSVVLGIFFLFDLMLGSGLDLNYFFLGGLGFRCITFFAKLPVYSFHHWLPKAHVECLALGSAILAGILLKLGSFSILGHKIFFFLGGLLCLKCLYDMWSTSDFKIWVAYSSISHITLVFSGFVVYYKMSYVYYFVPHTLLSGLMFYYFSKDYYYLGSRNFFYFTSSSYLYLVVAWCRVPLFLSFLPELMILLSFFKFSVFRFLVYFLNFVLFFFVLCKLCWRSFLNSHGRLNFYDISYIFYCFSFFIFWVFL
jgi:NADH:ubiquinone oxidoreductase subunit 4 (subunit M)